MKIPVLLSALALVCGAAVAAPQYGSGSSDRAAAHPSAAASSDTSSGNAKGGGLLERTKNAFHRLGDKIRHATRKSTDRDQTSAKGGKGDTRSMGAAGSPSQDSARQRRMDDAYANSKAKQQK